MTTTIQVIPFSNLALAFIPTLIVVAILYKWSGEHRTALYGISRMLVQLLLLGYFLSYIFESNSGMVVVSVIAVMVFVSSWIALRTVKTRRRALYTKAFASLLLGGGVTLLLVTQGVLNLDPWYYPNYFIPLAGIAIFVFGNRKNKTSGLIEEATGSIQAPKESGESGT